MKGQRSYDQVKVHGPPPLPIYNEVEAEIYDCIRTGLDQAKLLEFISPDEEIVENLVAEQEQYATPPQQPNSDLDIPNISYTAALLRRRP